MEQMSKLENISIKFFTLFRLKVDLTKYIEEHMFKFDSAFGDQTTNQHVCLWVIVVLLGVC